MNATQATVAATQSHAQRFQIDTHGGGTGAEGSHLTATRIIWIFCVSKG